MQRISRYFRSHLWPRKCSCPTSFEHFTQLKLQVHYPRNLEHITFANGRPTRSSQSAVRRWSLRHSTVTSIATKAHPEDFYKTANGNRFLKLEYPLCHSCLVRTCHPSWVKFTIEACWYIKLKHQKVSCDLVHIEADEQPSVWCSKYLTMKCEDPTGVSTANERSPMNPL